MLSELEVARFKREGFLLLKNVFSPAEVARFIELGSGAPRSRDLLAIPALASFWCDPRLLDIARRLLGNAITFFGEATYLHEVFRPGESATGRHLHHDAKGTLDHLFSRQHAPTAEPYPIIRFAIYLQDHASGSGGLKLVPGSHQIDSGAFDQAKLDYLDVPSQPGDLVVFCNKILHSPHALRLKERPNVGISPAREGEMLVAQAEAFLPAPRERNVIFVDFSGSNELADIYIKSRAVHILNPREGLVTAFGQGPLRSDAARAGVNLRLDAGVVEAITKVAASLVNGQVSEAGIPYLLALPELCRMSKAWSPHFDFIPQTPRDDSVETAINLYAEMFPRLKALRKQHKTATRDEHMATYDHRPA